MHHFGVSRLGPAKDYGHFTVVSWVRKGLNPFLHLASKGHSLPQLPEISSPPSEKGPLPAKLMYSSVASLWPLFAFLYKLRYKYLQIMTV